MAEIQTETAQALPPVRIPPDEGELRQRMIEYQDGSEEAFVALFHQLEPQVVRFLSALTRNGTAASDLAQEVFLQLHRARRTYDPIRPLLPWVLAIARNVYLMDLRRSRRRIRLEELQHDPPAHDPRAGQNALEDGLRAALAQVPAPHREAWILHHWIGLSFQEISGLLGATVSAVKVRSSRASTRLRELLRAAGLGGAER